tara:strand:- start:405 stop:1508 length:1104 start_codon:yes stop_codon:yes gene_type:complete
MFKSIIIFLFTATSLNASIGEITQSSGTSTVKREDEKFIGQQGLDLEMNDNVRTDDGKLRLDFIDDTRVDVTAHSRMTIDEFIYDPQTKTGALSIKATLGAVRYASGQIAKNSRQRVNIRTPSATIAVRGTDFMMIIDEIGGSMITLLPSCDVTGSCIIGEISVSSDIGTIIMNQAFQTTYVSHSGAQPGPSVILDLPESLLTSMLIIRKKSPYTEQILSQTPETNLLDIDFLKFDELDRDPLVESIKNIWVTDLDNTTYLDSEFYDALARQLAQIMAQWFDELMQQNEAFFQEKFLGLDPDTNIFYDEPYPYYVVSRGEGDQHFFQLRLGQGNSYSIDMVQGAFSSYGYKVGVGGANSITINQNDY